MRRTDLPSASHLGFPKKTLGAAAGFYPAQSCLHPRPQGSFDPACSTQAGSTWCCVAPGNLTVINDLLYWDAGGKGQGDAACQGLEQGTHGDGSEMAAKAPKRRETWLSQGLIPPEPPAFPTALRVHTYKTFMFPSKLPLDLCLWEKLMEYVVRRKGLRRQSEEQSGGNLLPGAAAAGSPCCTGLTVPAARAACSSLGLNTRFIYKMHYLPV